MVQRPTTVLYLGEPGSQADDAAVLAALREEIAESLRVEIGGMSADNFLVRPQRCFVAELERILVKAGVDDVSLTTLRDGVDSAAPSACWSGWIAKPRKMPFLPLSAGEA